MNTTIIIMIFIGAVVGMSFGKLFDRLPSYTVWVLILVLAVLLLLSLKGYI